MSVGEINDRLPLTLSVIRDGIDRQLHTGCQIFISHSGRTVVDCGIGDSLPGQPMTSETINLWLSSGKPLTAVAICQQWERDRLQLDDRITTFIPEFEAGGKKEVTIRHLLTHTGGFRTVETGWPNVSWDETIRRICEAPVEVDWIVGKTAGYHTASSWFILGEILARLTGRIYADAIRQDLFEMVGMVDARAAMTPDQIEGYRNRLGGLYARERGELQLLDWNNPLRCGMPSPGANTRGPIRELGRFYEMLLNKGKTARGRVLTAQTVDTLTARHRVGVFDSTLAHIVDFGLGVICDSNQYGADTVPYGYGKYCSPRTFGHGGAQSSQGWCDPENELVVAYFLQRSPGRGPTQQKGSTIE